MPVLILSKEVYSLATFDYFDYLYWSHNVCHYVHFSLHRVPSLVVFLPHARLAILLVFQELVYTCILNIDWFTTVYFDRSDESKSSPAVKYVLSLHRVSCSFSSIRSCVCATTTTKSWTLYAMNVLFAWFSLIRHYAKLRFTYFALFQSRFRTTPKKMSRIHYNVLILRTKSLLLSVRSRPLESLCHL